MKKKRVILVSGMSGAGKTSATSVLEDMGYHCIDQFPVQLLSLLVDLIENSTDPRYSYLALATSAKDFPEFLKAFEGEDMDVRVLFLDASNEELLHRYKSTRRTHPLLISNACNTLEEAISVERQMFQNYKDTAFLLVDTTFLKASELKQKIEKYFSLSSAPVFSISFISFGYKHGVPLDADLMIDVRFLPNPHWNPELRPMTGLDEPVAQFLLAHDEVNNFIYQTRNYIETWLPMLEQNNRSYLTIAIGCTGGKHRSVYIAQQIGEYFQAKGKNVKIQHKSLEKN